MTASYDPRLFLFFVLHPKISHNLLGLNVGCPRVDGQSGDTLGINGMEKVLP
jgi:hypothetical protein